MLTGGLGHRIVWYMNVNGLEEHFGSLFTGHRKLNVLNETAVLTNQTAQSSSPEY